MDNLDKFTMKQSRITIVYRLKHASKYRKGVCFFPVYVFFSKMKNETEIIAMITHNALDFLKSPLSCMRSTCGKSNNAPA